MTGELAPLDVLGATFRANPGYELVLFDRLAPEHQAMLSDLRGDPELYGILRPRETNGLGIKSIGRDAALLYLTLQQPGPLPAYAKAQLGADGGRAVATLVLDGVLQIACGDPADAEAFASGAEAYPMLYGERTSSDSGGRLAQISVGALRYAQALAIGDVGRLSARLYFYNRQPASPRCLQRLPDADAVTEFLGIGDRSPSWKELRRHWSEVRLAPPHTGWRLFRRLDETGSSGPRAGYKLYISPVVDALPEAFGAILEALTAGPSARFKIGRDAYGLLRPDKLMAYFTSLEALNDGADRVRAAVAGCPAHGVPFSAAWTDDGLLSWGMDPPREQRLVGWQEQESWRLWLTNRLATALVAAGASRTLTMEPWQFALNRVALEGVDTATWTPAPTIWDDASAET